MKKSRRIILCGLICALAQALPAHAQQVHVEGQPCPLPVVEDALAPSEVTDFAIWGYTEPGLLLVQIGDREVHVAREDMETLLPQLDLNSFPDVTGSSPIQAGSPQDEVRVVQEQLAATGFLDGAADGIFGQGTSSAIRGFQTAHGLNDTGIADLATQLALQSAAAGTLDTLLEVMYPSEITVENRFGELAGKIDANLENYLDPSLKFTYDVFEGRGSLDPGIAVGSYEVWEPAIDMLSFGAAVKIMLIRAEGEDKVSMIPSLTVDSRGAYRPYIQEAVLQSGVDVCTLKGAVITGSLDGTTLTESAYIPLTEEAASFVREHEEINIRIKGKNENYEFPMQNREQAGNFITDVLAAE